MIHILLFLARIITSVHSNFIVEYLCHLDLSLHPVQNVLDCEKLMERGWKNRATGATLMNADSSRSHSIFSISLEMMPICALQDGGCSDDADHIRRGKLNLVDLAGSERQAKTGKYKIYILIDTSFNIVILHSMKECFSVQNIRAVF
jgi:hypothetical protein